MNKTLFIPEQKTPYFTMRSLRVIFDWTPSSLKKTLSQKEMDVLMKVYEGGSIHPKKARKEILKILPSYPHHPELLNVSAYLLLACRKVKKAEKFIIENYTHNPDYLLAKINYADYCIRHGKAQEILGIFGQKLDLRFICPDRSLFHLSEFRGFMVIMGFYHLAIQKKEAAEGYFYLAHKVDKAHPSVQSLKKKLYNWKDKKYELPY